MGANVVAPVIFTLGVPFSLPRKRHPALPPADYLPNLLQATRYSPIAYAFYPRFDACSLYFSIYVRVRVCGYVSILDPDWRVDLFGREVPLPIQWFTGMRLIKA